MQSRGRDDAHPTARDRPGIPVVQMDYSFFRSGHEAGRLQPILIGILVKNGYGYAATALAKVQPATARSLPMCFGSSRKLAWSDVYDYEQMGSQQ